MGALFELLEKIQKKPALYIGAASVSHLRMFIVGYRFARAEAGLEASEAEIDFYKNFQPWLQNKLSIRTVNSWDRLISLTCINEKAAFDYFFQLLHEFRQRDKMQDTEPLLEISQKSETGKVA